MSTDLNKKRGEILEYLNANELTFELMSDGEEFEVCGVSLVGHIDEDSYSEDVVASLTGDDGFYFKREGLKEISYGNWVSTNWLAEWESVA